ncbi:MAG: hypothetical protein WBC24_03835 [Methylovirgula sp.]
MALASASSVSPDGTIFAPLQAHAARRTIDAHRVEIEGENAMAYLDVGPMIGALREAPGDFDMSAGRLRHMPSGHKVVFDPFGGNARIDAFCACATLQISRPQSAELLVAFRQWRQDYWRAVEINREFAGHFRPDFAHRACVRLLNYLLDHPHPFAQPPVPQQAEQSAN